MSAGSQSNQGTTIVASAADHFGELVIAKSKAFVKKNPVISLTWVGGLLLSIFATGFTPSMEAVRKYEVREATSSVPDQSRFRRECLPRATSDADSPYPCHDAAPCMTGDEFLGPTCSYAGNNEAISETLGSNLR